MRVLVTGGAGFIGSHVVLSFVEGGDRVHIVVRPDTAGHRLDGLPDGVTPHRVDLTDLAGVEAVLAAHPPDVVIHAASSPGHPSTAESRLAIWRDDVIATATLLEALRRHPPRRLVHVGSSLVYRPSNGSLGEDAVLGPETPRGVTKLAASVAAQQWSLETGVPCVVIRPFSVYGPGEGPHRVVPTVIRALRTGAPFAFTPDESRRDFIHVTDVARCVTLAANSPAAGGRVFNVGTGVERTVEELVAVAERVTGKLAVKAPEPHPPTAPRRPHWCADSTLAAELLGWRAEISLEDGLAMLWEDAS